MTANAGNQLTWLEKAQVCTHAVGACVLVLSITGGVGAREPATLEIGGALIPHPLRLSASDLAAMPRRAGPARVHHLSGTWVGGEVGELLTRAGVPD